MRKWSKRYLEKEEEGLTKQTRRPHHSPTRKINEELTNLVMDPGGQNYPAKVDYTYDSLRRPVTRKDYFNTPNPDYTYNDRGELTADAMSREGTYSYAYDNIGKSETGHYNEKIAVCCKELKHEDFFN